MRGYDVAAAARGSVQGEDHRIEPASVRSHVLMQGRAVPEDFGVAAFVTAGDQQRLSGPHGDLAYAEVRNVLVARRALGRDTGRLKISGSLGQARTGQQRRHEYKTETEA